MAGIFQSDLIPGGKKKKRNENHWSVYLPWDPRYSAGMHHASDVYILYDFAVLAMYECWMSPIGAVLSREKVSSKYIVAVFTYSPQFHSVTFWWHRDVRAAGVVPSGVNSASRVRSEHWLKKNGPAVVVPSDILARNENGCYNDTTDCELCGEQNPSGSVFCLRCFVAFEWLETPAGSAALASAVGGDGGSAALASAVTIHQAATGPATTNEITVTLLRDLMASMAVGDDQASAADDPSVGVPAPASSASTFASSLVPVTPHELRLLRYRGMTRMRSSELVTEIIKKQKDLRKHRTKWVDDSVHRQFRADKGWIWLVCGERISAWSPDPDHVRAIPVGCGYTIWENSQDVNTVVTNIILDGSSGESEDFLHKRALIDEFVYSRESQITVLESWQEGKSVPFYEPEESVPQEGTKKKKQKIKSDPPPTPGGASSASAASAQDPSAPSGAYTRVKRTLPDLPGFDMTAHRKRVAVSVFLMISELHLASAQLVSLDSVVLLDSWSWSEFHVSFDGWSGLIYFVLLHVFALIGLISMSRAFWSYMSPRAGVTISTNSAGPDGAVDMYLRLTKDELVEACRKRKLKVSGTKAELATRLANWCPVSAPTERPSESQLSFLAALELRTGVRAAPMALLCKRHCSQEIDRLRGIES